MRKIKFKTSPAVNPWFPMLGVLPAVLLITIFSLGPALLNLVLSFTDYRSLTTPFKYIGFRNYIEFFTVIGPEVGSAFWVTIKYALLTVVPNNLIAIGAALLVNAKIRGKNLFRALFFMPSILGSVVISFAWRLIFDTEWGPLADIFAAIGIQTAFLGDPNASLYCIVVIALWASFGYSMVIYLAGLQGISKDYYEAASIDGAQGFTMFRKITFPLLWPAVVICLWIGISGSLGMADYILLTTGGEYGTETIGFYIYRVVFYGFNTQGMNSAIIIYNFLFVSIIMMLFNLLVKKREGKIYD